MHFATTIRASAALLLLAACAEPQTADSITSAARANFSERIAPYQDHPRADMVADLGPPDHDTANKEGGRKLIWERHDSKTLTDKEVVPVVCTVTALTNAQDMVYFVFAGGNTVYCSEVFGKTTS